MGKDKGIFRGPKGDIGLTGPQGPKGDTGATGAQGPKGDSGASDNILAFKTNTLIYTIAAKDIPNGYNGGSCLNIFTKDWDQLHALSIGSVNGIINGLTIMPYTDNVWYLGGNGRRYKCLYSVNGTIQTSDRNKKKDIKEFDDNFVKDFVMGIKPVQYKFIDGNIGRTHYGIVAQDIEQLLSDLNITSMDFAGFIKSNKTKDVEIYEDYEEEILNNETGETETVTKKEYNLLE